MPEPKQSIPDDFMDYLPAYNRLFERSTRKEEEQSLREMLGELHLKIDNLNVKLDRIFGNGILINGRFVSLKL